METGPRRSARRTKGRLLWRGEGTMIVSALSLTISQLSKMITFAVSLPLSTKHRITEISFHPTQPYLAVQSHDKNIDILRVRTEEEIRKKIARRKRREREKSKAKASQGKSAEQLADEDGMDGDGEQQNEVSLVDLFTPYLVIRASGKVRSFSFSGTDNSAKGGVHVSAAKIARLQFLKYYFLVQILAALATNSVEVYSIPAPTKAKENVQEATRVYALDLPGHRTDIRTLCVSSDDQLVASASNGKKFNNGSSYNLSPPQIQVR